MSAAATPTLTAIDHDVATTSTPTPGVATRENQDAREQRSQRRQHLARLLAGRTIQAVVVVWLAVTLTFIGIHLAPGDTVDTLLGLERNDPELRSRVIAEWGLDRPALVQYLAYLGGLLRGDFGISYVQNRPVVEIFSSQIGATLQLAGAALLIAVVIALLLSLSLSGRRGLLRQVAGALELMILSVPSFWLGLLLLTLFSFQLRWFPVVGTDGLRALVLPALAIGVPTGAYLTQVLREDLDAELAAPYVLTSRSRGASVARVKIVHALRHACLPALTIGGLIVGGLLGGAAITEQVFGRSGLGHIAVAAVHSQDVPVILGLSFFASAVFVIASTVVDLVALWIDPRMRRRR
ncbi:ABC transporter permease [Actinomyces faecalis]|uniref:ABC transporter permease n=1 Tax=Actinomyces faecalis TaxID=2722820 RepID=UPI0015553D55|nr:ABC transporter permease [Actinomyces faecalis]